MLIFAFTFFQVTAALFIAALAVLLIVVLMALLIGWLVER